MSDKCHERLWTQVALLLREHDSLHPECVESARALIYLMRGGDDGPVHPHRLLLRGPTPIEGRLELLLGTARGRHGEID